MRATQEGGRRETVYARILDPRHGVGDEFSFRAFLLALSSCEIPLNDAMEERAKNTSWNEQRRLRNRNSKKRRFIVHNINQSISKVMLDKGLKPREKVRHVEFDKKRCN